MPRIMPEPRYFSMPSVVVGTVLLRKTARNWTPWVRSLVHAPLAWMNSPAEIEEAWPTTVTRSRCPRTWTRRTQKPFSGLWNVTRSTRPDSGSRSGLVGFTAERGAANAMIGVYRLGPGTKRELSYQTCRRSTTRKAPQSRTRSGRDMPFSLRRGHPDPVGSALGLFDPGAVRI